MPTWYRVTIESDDPADATRRADSFEQALTALLRAAPASPGIDAYCDGLPQRRGRVFWLSQGAFEAASGLARSHDAYAYPGLVDMRFLTPLSF